MKRETVGILTTNLVPVRPERKAADFEEAR